MTACSKFTKTLTFQNFCTSSSECSTLNLFLFCSFYQSPIRAYPGDSHDFFLPFFFATVRGCLWAHSSDVSSRGFVCLVLFFPSFFGWGGHAPRTGDKPSFEISRADAHVRDEGLRHYWPGWPADLSRRGVHIHKKVKPKKPRETSKNVHKSKN